MRRLSLSSRLALLFAGCTAVVSLFAGVLLDGPVKCTSWSWTSS